MAIYTERWPSPQYAANTITELELNHTQNITGNYTTVSYAVRVKRINNYNDNWTPSSGGSYTTLSIGGISVLDGARHNWTTLSNNANHTATVVSGSVNVPHAADGKKTIAYSLTLKPNISSISTMPDRVISGSFTPPAIPRVSKATISKASFNFGEAVTLTTNRASTAFTHKVYYIDSAGTVTLSTNMGASGSISVPVARMSSHITSASVAMTIRVITVSAGVDIGTHNISVTVNVPSSVIPTVGSLAVAETVTKAAAVFSSEAQFISGVSRVKATAGSVSGVHGSTIARYYFQVKEVTSFAMNSTANNVTFPAFNFPTSGSAIYTIQVRVMDSRGRYSAWRNSGVFRVHYYRPPTIGNPTTIRLATATTLQVVRNYSVQEINQSGSAAQQRNTASYYIRTRAVGSTTWTTNTSAGNTELFLTNSSANLAGSFSASTMWEVQAVVTDKLNTATSAVITVSTEFATMEILKGTGIGVGKAPVAGQGNLQVGAGGINSEGSIRVNGSATQAFRITTDSGSPTTTAADLNNRVVGLESVSTTTTNNPVGYGTVLGLGGFEILIGSDNSARFRRWSGSPSTPGSWLNAMDKDGTLLPSNANLNSYTGTGYYYNNTNDGTATFTNASTDISAGYMEVFKGGSMTWQRWTNYRGTHGNRSFIRNAEGDNWGSWVETTSGITTSGSTPNGMWYKTGDLLICTQNFSINHLHSTYTLTGTWTFPVAFSEAPSVSLLSRTNLTDSQELMNGTLSQLGNATTAKVDMGWMRASGANFTSNSKKYLSAFAIGKA